MQHEENKWIIYQSWLRSDFSRVMNWGVVELRTGFFLSFFSPLYPSPLSLSHPLRMNSEESTLHTGKLLIHGGTTGELFAVDWSRGVDSAVSDHESRGNLCYFSLFLCLICVLKQGFFVYWYNPPPSFPKNVCVSTYSNKAFLCIKSFWVKF